MPVFRTLPTIAFTIAALAVNGQAQAQGTFPSRTIRIVVGFPAGGPSDIPARLIAEKLKVSLGQNVIVENKPGAAGQLAVTDLLSQPRDGHTLLLCSYIDPINTFLYKKVNYKLGDLAPISLVQKAFYAFAIGNELPASNLREFIAYAKTKPGVLNYGVIGPGSVTELLAKQLEKVAGIQMTAITHRGTGPALQEMVAGRLDFMVGPLANTIPLYQAKRLKIVGMTSPERLAVAPEVPTLKEQGTPIVNYGWWGVCAASGVPKPVVDLLSKRVAEAVASPEFKSVIEKTGVIAISSTPADFAKVIAETTAEAQALIRDLGIPQIE
jgi:tripartite-type tricarboxylate transporter receptor subunit TctC